jgi:type IV pilus assembly protein PilC
MVYYMKIIKYLGKDLNGKSFSGTCKYDELDKIKKEFSEKGLYIYKISRKIFWKKVFYVKPNLLDISIMCSKLNIMLSSGISISKAFMSLESQSQNKLLKYTISDIIGQLMQGRSLYLSIKKFKTIFPDYMIEMIGVGEESGNLEGVLKELSEYYEREYKIHSDLKSALVYPALTFIISICIVIYLTSSIIPKFIDIMNFSNIKIPLITSFIISAFKFLNIYFFYIISIVFAFITILYKFLKSKVGKYILDSMKMKLPYFNKIYSEILMLRIVSSMRILSLSGVNILRALYVTSKTIGNNVIEQRMNDSISEIKRGKSIHNAFKKCKIGNDLFLYMMKTGEESGNLDFIFHKLQIIFASDVQRNLKVLVKVVEPIIIIFLSFFIGIFIVAAIMPIFNIMDSIS